MDNDFWKYDNKRTDNADSQELKICQLKDSESL